LKKKQYPSKFLDENSIKRSFFIAAELRNDICQMRTDSGYTQHIEHQWNKISDILQQVFQ